MLKVDNFTQFPKVRLLGDPEIISALAARYGGSYFREWKYAWTLIPDSSTLLGELRCSGLLLEDSGYLEPEQPKALLKLLGELPPPRGWCVRCGVQFWSEDEKVWLLGEDLVCEMCGPGDTSK